jgi:hypothetical protein
MAADEALKVLRRTTLARSAPASSMKVPVALGAAVNYI